MVSEALTGSQEPVGHRPTPSPTMALSPTLSDAQSLVSELAPHATLRTVPPALMQEVADVIGVQPMDVVAGALTNEGVQQIAYALGWQAGEQEARARFVEVPMDTFHVQRMRKVLGPITGARRGNATAMEQALLDTFASGVWQGMVTQVVRSSDSESYRAVRQRAQLAEQATLHELQEQIASIWPLAEASSAAARELLVLTAELALSRHVLADVLRKGWENRFLAYRSAGYSATEALEHITDEIGAFLNVEEVDRHEARRFVLEHGQSLLEKLNLDSLLEKASPGSLSFDAESFASALAEGVAGEDVDEPEAASNRWQFESRLAEVMPGETLIDTGRPRAGEQPKAPSRARMH